VLAENTEAVGNKIGGECWNGLFYVHVSS
jgi:hypothetical protein